MIAIVVLSGFGLALVAPAVQRLLPRHAGWLLALLPLGVTVTLARHAMTIADGGVIAQSHAWAPALGVTLSFYLDGLSLLFALLISGIGTLIVIYSGAYLSGHPNLGRFYAYLLAFMASMLGLVLAGNLIAVFIFWELTSLSSYLLIGFEHEREAARKAALQALLVTGIGGLALMAGLVLMALAGNSWELAEMLDRRLNLAGHPFYLAIVILIFAGAFTKSAQTPFHFWLPSAMEGPTPVSAFLHSATMVKGGVYLVLRLTPILGGTAAWQTTLMLVGAVTMILGAWLSLLQTDLKRLLAYSTVNGLGTLMFLTGIGTRTAIIGAVVFLVAHALYKASLFLNAGVVDHETGTRDVRRLGGLYRHLPLIGSAAVLAGLSMAGLAPFWGFIGKELIYEATWQSVGQTSGLLTTAAVAANALLIAATGVLVIKPFFGPVRTVPDGHHPVGPALWLGPLLPAVLGLLCGLLPGWPAQVFITPAVAAVLAQPQDIHLALWHGFTPMLGLTGLTLLLAFGVYRRHAGIRDGSARFALGACGPAAGYEISLNGMMKLAKWQTRFLQSGYLHNYILTLIIATIALVGYTLLRGAPFQLTLPAMDVKLYEGVLAALMLSAAVVTVRAQSRLSAIVAMGVVGYGLALLFIDFGAPDLAMTQFIIETMTVILFVFVIYRLPAYKIISTPRQFARNGVVAVAAGVLMTTLVLVALGVREGSLLSEFFEANSFIKAHGRNIVNVIIVDFRAMDTLGEITVLTLAGAGVYTLLKLRPKEDR